MKKIVNINLKGRIIPIEEAAFESIQKYVESLRFYFRNEEGKDEIISDIEDRIAELFDKEIKKGTPCITDDIAKSVMKSMGNIEDFEKMDGLSENLPKESNTNESEREPKGSLSRNSNDKILGGVCSGIAHSIRIDPTVVRVLFAVLSLGWGTGILIYLILWAALPAKALPPASEKRLFRNPDQKVIAGIGGGIASYFNVPVWIPRLIFLLPVITGIFTSTFPHFFIFTGGFGGTLILIYIILWIVLPEAITPSEKLQMKGKKIDIDSIKSAVQNELQEVPGRLNKIGKQFETRAKIFSKEAQEAAENLSQTLSHSSSKTGNKLLHIAGILFRITFWIFASISLLILITVFFALAIGSAVFSQFSDFIFSGQNQLFAFWGIVLFFLLLPAVSLLFIIIKKIAGIRKSRPILSYLFYTLWSLGWISIFYLASSLVKDFSRKKERLYSMNILSHKDSILQITTDQPAILYTGSYNWIDINEDGFDITDDSLYYSNIEISFIPSNDSSGNIIQHKISYGSSASDAEKRAANLKHSIRSADHNLFIDHAIVISKKDRFRGQRVEIDIQIPVGKKVVFDEKLTKRLNNFEINRSKDTQGEYEFDIDHKLFDYKPGIIYIMTEKGLTKY